MARLFDEIEELRNMPRLPVVVDISNVNAYYMMHDKDEWVIQDDFPNCAPPFDFAFYEMRGVSKMKINGVVHERHDVQNLRYGMLVEAHEGKDYQPAYLMLLRKAIGTDDAPDAMLAAVKAARWMCFAGAYVTNGARVVKTHLWFWCVGHDGKVIPGENGSPYLMGITNQLRAFLASTDSDIHFAASQFNAGLFHPYLLATSFMHCKNVVRIENTPPAKASARRIKEGRPALVSYYTLQIEPMREVLKREGGVETNGLKRALHICRGHFATYDEKPLFGRVKGTFWIPQHTRGSARQGIVAKDYSVDMPRQ